VDDCSALTDELRLREDTFDPIDIHLELNFASLTSLRSLGPNDLITLNSTSLPHRDLTT